jgi:cyclic pyranopterin monophosphate synthase
MGRALKAVARRNRSKRGTPAVLSHVNADGTVRMVDVGAKPATSREAIARGRITMSQEAVRQIRAGAVKKGDPLQTARIAGIMAAKQTAHVIPLCHPLPLSHVDVALLPIADGYDIEARVRTTAQTGVEMEALHAVAVAALTVYDMIKAVDKRMVIGDIRLVEKRGGQGGDFQR